MSRGRTIVVGGGIAGLAAAYFLGEDRTQDVLLLEGSPQVGGKLRLHEVAGLTVDVGAEAMLNRRPEGVDLARALGIDVVHPTAASSRIWTRGELRTLPRSLMGAPLDLDQLSASGVLSQPGLARAREELSLGPERIDGDISVGDLVSRRFGKEVTDRLVEPLLGGVYAGHARELSARATVPQLVGFAERGSVLAQAPEIPTIQDVPVFAGIAGGLGRLPDELVGSGRFAVRTGVTVRELRQVASGFELVAGSTRDPELLAADRVVLATPAAPTSRLLAGLAPSASEDLAAIEYASMAIVTMAFRASSVVELVETTGSGFLVPPIDGHRIKAATFSFAKWDWVREAGREEDVLVLRTSLGRHREESSLQLTDQELVEVSLADLASGHRTDRRAASTYTCRDGVADFRSTPSATSTGWPGSGPACVASRDWRCAVPPTTAWASPPSSPRPAVPPPRSPRHE